MAYSDKVLDHYENPRNVGTFEEGDEVGTGMVGAPACGDVIKSKSAMTVLLRMQNSKHMDVDLQLRQVLF